MYMFIRYGALAYIALQLSSKSRAAHGALVLLCRVLTFPYKGDYRNYFSISPGVSMPFFKFIVDPCHLISHSPELKGAHDSLKRYDTVKW